MWECMLNHKPANRNSDYIRRRPVISDKIVVRSKTKHSRWMQHRFTQWDASSTKRNKERSYWVVKQQSRMSNHNYFKKGLVYTCPQPRKRGISDNQKFVFSMHAVTCRKCTRTQDIMQLCVSLLRQLQQPKVWQPTKMLGIWASSPTHGGHRTVHRNIERK